MIKLLFILYTFLLTYSCCFAQNPTKVKLNSLTKLINNNWEYSHSIYQDSTFKVSGNYFNKGYVPYRIEIKKFSKKANNRLNKKFPNLKKHREQSCLHEFTFWVDYKGRMRYPRLISNKVDSNGNLLECNLDLIYENDASSTSNISIISLTKKQLIISNYQNDKRPHQHVYTLEKQ